MKKKLLFQNSFLILVLALIITKAAVDRTFFQANSQGQPQQQQQKIQSSQSEIQNIVSKYDWPNIHENVLTDFNSNVSYPTIENTAFIHPLNLI